MIIYLKVVVLFTYFSIIFLYVMNIWMSNSVWKRIYLSSHIPK